MAILNGQASLSLSNLYNIEQDTAAVFKHKTANIWFDDGTLDIYISESSTQPTALSQMTLSSSDTALTAGYRNFAVVPKYIAFVQNTGTTNELISSGLRIIEDLGAIS